MTDPIRLLEDGGEEFERALLASAAHDRASERAKFRALAVFGSVGLNLATTTAAASPSTFAAAAASGFVTAPAPIVTLGALAKWIGTGVLAGTVSAGGVYALQLEPQNAVVPPPVSAPSDSAVPRAERAAPRSFEPAPPASAPRNETRAAERERTPPRKAAPADPGAAASSGEFPLEASSLRLSEEVAALERARRSLRNGDPRTALAELGRYEARFPRGALLHEAVLLTVEAKLDLGDVSGARAVGSRVLAVDGTSPHARRIRALFAAKGVQ